MRAGEAQLQLDSIPETDEPGLVSHSTDEKTEAQARLKGIRGHQDQFPIIQMRKLRPREGVLPSIMAEDQNPRLPLHSQKWAPLSLSLLLTRHPTRGERVHSCQLPGLVPVPYPPVF